MESSASRPCTLCLQQRPIRHSHILPEFFYTPVYGERHAFKLIQNRPGGARTGTKEKGLREYLLCHECEQGFGRYESYAAPLLRKIDAASKTSSDVKIAFDPHQFRLFSLSLLWRTGVAKGTMFRSVRLGPHEERLRKMLQAGDPGEPHEYGFLFGRTELGDLQHHPILAPTPNRSERYRVYQLNALGYLWKFYVDSDLRGISERIPFVGSGPELIVPLIGAIRFSWKRDPR
jgi:hypothetical protein